MRTMNTVIRVLAILSSHCPFLSCIRSQFTSFPPPRLNSFQPFMLTHHITHILTLSHPFEFRLIMDKLITNHKNVDTMLETSKGEIQLDLGVNNITVTTPVSIALLSACPEPAYRERYDCSIDQFGSHPDVRRQSFILFPWLPFHVCSLPSFLSSQLLGLTRSKRHDKPPSISLLSQYSCQHISLITSPLAPLTPSYISNGLSPPKSIKAYGNSSISSGIIIRHIDNHSVLPPRTSEIFSPQIVTMCRSIHRLATTLKPLAGDINNINHR